MTNGICDKCGESSNTINIENHRLCDKCYKLWCDFVRIHKLSEKLTNISDYSSYDKLWEKVYAEFLNGKETVQFT